MLFGDLYTQLSVDSFEMRKTVVYPADHDLDVPSSPSRRLVSRLESTRPWYVRVRDSTNYFMSHDLSKSLSTIFFVFGRLELRWLEFVFLFGEACIYFFGHAFYETGLSRQNGYVRSTGLQSGTKSAFRPADRPLINRLSTRCVPPPVYIEFVMFVLLGTFKRRFVDA